MGDIALVLLGVLILLGLVAMFMSHKTWPIYTIILLFFNMAAAAGFVYLGARTLKTYDVWRSEVRGWEATAKEKAKQVEDLTNGGGDGADAVSLANLQLAVTKTLAHRGGVWGLLTVDERQKLNGQPPIVANLTAMGSGVTAKITWRTEPLVGLEKGKSLYLFADPLADDRGPVKADHYLGHYLVESIEGKSATLVRFEALLPGENVMANNRPVVIYDMFPNDDYRTFAGKSLAELKQLLPGVDDATLQQFVKHGNPVTAAEEQALQAQAAIDDELKTAQSTLNKARVWHRVSVVELLPASEVSGQAAPMPMPAEGEGPLAVEEAVPATFGIGQKLVLDPDTAKQLVAAGKVKYDGDNYRVYMRPLRDYPAEYKRTRENFVDITHAIAEIDRLEKLNALTKVSTEATIAAHLARTALVSEDLANLKKETAALTAYDSQIRQRVSALRTEWLGLLEYIDKTAAAIMQFQMEALRKVNSRIAAQEQAAVQP